MSRQGEAAPTAADRPGQPRGWPPMMLATVIAVAIATFLSIVIGRRARVIGDRLGLLDWPDPNGGRKRHDRVTPLVGGSAVVLSALAAAFMAWLATGSPIVADHLVWFSIAVGALYLIGLADDRFGLGPRLRLVFGLGIFLLATVYAPDFRLSFLRFSAGEHLWLLGSLATAFTVICLVGLLNAVNMADGKNGLVVSLSLFWAAMLWIDAPGDLDPVFAALIAALAVIWRYNMADRLFLGDGGSYGLSAILGLLAIYTYNHGFDILRADRVALLFAVPVFDTIRLISTRAARGRSPFAADRDHLHHHIAYRWGWPTGLGVYLAIVIVPNLLALAVPELAPLLLVLTALAYGATLVMSTRRTAFSGELAAKGPDTLRTERGGARPEPAGGA